MIYRLQGCKKSAVIGWMAGMLLVAGCTQDKLADASQGEILPEGKYPMTFTATGLQIPAATRATADGTWTAGDEVAVKVDGMTGVKKYTAANGSSASTTLKAASGVTPFYWQSTGDINVSAWYPGSGYTDGTTPTKWKWSVQPEQNSGDGYQKSDFLYAPQTAIDFKGTRSLTFYHQTAKVVVNIRKQGVANDADKITSVMINAVKDGDFTTTLTDHCGLSAKSDVNPSDITSFKLANPNENVVFKDGENGETALASYQALVIPQEVNKTTITINIDGYAPFKYTPTVPGQSGKWAGGTQYTYNLTIDGKEVTATTSSTIGWTENTTTGSGSVEI